VLKLAFKKYKGLYFVGFGNVISILIEFLAILILGMISQQTIELPILFLHEVHKDELFILFIFLFIIRFTSLFILESWITYYAKEMQVYLSSTAFSKVVHENIKEIEKVEIGHYVTLSGDEASNASQLLISMIGIINNFLLVIAYMVSVIIFSHEIVSGLAALLFIIIFSAKMVYKKLFRLGYEQVALRRKTSSLFIDAFNGLRVLKSFSLESYVANEYKEEVAKYFSVNSRLIIFNNLNKYIPIVLLFGLFQAYLLYYYFGDKSHDIAYLITLLFILMRLLQTIGSLSGLLGKVGGELKGVCNIVDFIKDFSVNNKKVALNNNIKEIKIENISFSYGNNKVFDDVSFLFKEGESYAIYGESGVGKSTLLDLMMDFISPEKGRVLVNNINVQDINETSLTQRVMYVGQESLIFNRSIKENIELDGGYDNDTLLKVLQLVKLDELVEQLEGGLDHILFYKGTNLSGGQRQRINLARALIRKPDVLILDEATSALDPQIKDFIMANIIEEYREKILIFVTHDPAIFPLVDNVIDLQRNKR